MIESKIFNEKLDPLMSEIVQQDFLKKATVLGGQNHSDSLIIPFLGRQIVFKKDQIFDLSGQSISDAVKVLLCKYILLCPEKIIEGQDKLCTFRELENAGPLTSYFTSNTSKIIETTFSGRLPDLKKRCLQINGSILSSQMYDLSVQFKVLPRISVILNFNDEDEFMPAKNTFLFDQSVQKYLDLEGMTIIGTYLTGKLIEP